MVTRSEAIKKLTAPGEPLEIVEVEANGKRVRAFKNAPPTLRDLFEATRSDKTWLVYGDERLTYEDAWRQAATLATALVEDYGVVAGDRIAVSMRNYPEWMIAFTAATSIGAIFVGMNALWRSDEMAYGLSHSGAKVLLADQERLDRLAEIADPPSGLRTIAVRATKPLAAGVVAYAQVMDRPPADVMPPADIGPEMDALMLFTSGSTGHAKGAISSHRAVINPLLSWELDVQIAVMRGAFPQPDPEAPQGAVLLGIPLFHVTGLHAVALASYRYQRRMVLMYKWDAETAAQLVEREKITHFVAPSAVTGDLVEVARRGGYDLSSLVSVSGGGAPRPPEQVKAISEVFGGALPGTGWGMTETNAIGAGIGGQDYLDHPESAGQASAVLDLRVVAPDGRELAPRERGELQVRGVGMMREYWNRPDANAEGFAEDGWFRTGDVAYIDHEGFVFIVDRIKDLVIRGGENIGCARIEAAIAEHPAVLEACVYGVPDARLGEEIGATVHLEAPLAEADLRRFLESRLARHEIPRYFHFAPEPLPRIASGKILKRQLRDEAAERLKALVKA